jgi:predicted nucleic acid-binding protein
MIVYLDTNIVIYAVEQDPVFGPKARTRLARARAAGDTLTISDLTRMECLVGPLKSGDAAVEADFHTFFRVMNVVAITAAVCDRAARIRARYNFKPMDALQLAAAVEHGATVFLTADARLGSFTDLTVEDLS